MMCMSLAKVLACIISRGRRAFHIAHMTPHECIKEYLKMFLAYKINIAWDDILPPSFVK